MKSEKASHNPLIAAALIASGADVNATSRKSDTTTTPWSDKHAQTALHIAAALGDEEMVERLLDSGAMVDMQDSEGETALANAASAGHEKVV